MRAAAILVALAAVSLGGCVRMTDGQAAQAAQAKANMAAAGAIDKAAPTAEDPGAYRHAAAVLREAALARMSAAMANLDLPAPETGPDILAPAGVPAAPAITAESHAAAVAASDPPSGMLGMVLGCIGGVGLLAVGVLRHSPGAFGLLANLAHTVMAPKATKDMRAAQAKAADIADQAIAYGHAVTATAVAHGLGDKVEAVKAQAAQIQDRLGIRDHVAVILAKHKAGGSGIRPAIPAPPSPPT